MKKNILSIFKLIVSIETITVYNTIAQSSIVVPYIFLNVPLETATFYLIASFKVSSLQIGINIVQSLQTATVHKSFIQTSIVIPY